MSCRNSTSSSALFKLCFTPLAAALPDAAGQELCLTAAGALTNLSADRHGQEALLAESEIAVQAVLSFCKQFLDSSRYQPSGSPGAAEGAATDYRLRCLMLVMLSNMLSHPVLCRTLVAHKDCIPLLAAHLLAIPDATQGASLNRQVF